MFDEEQLRRSARELLRRYGPLRPPELMRHLVDDGAIGPGTSPADVGQLLLARFDEDGDEVDFAAFPLRDGRVCDLDHLLDGLTLTHVVTDGERAAGEVALDIDLAPIVMVGTDDGEVALADGGALDLSDVLAGPAGWLPAEPVLALTLGVEGMTVSGLDEVPPVDDRVVERLAAMHDELGPDDQYDVVELVLDARARYPKLLGAPTAPLGDLLALADLHETARGWLSHGDDLDEEDGFDPDPGNPYDTGPDDDELLEHLVADHGIATDTAYRLVDASGVVHDLAMDVVEDVIVPLVEAVTEDDGVSPERLDVTSRDVLGTGTPDVVLDLVERALQTTDVGHDLAAVLEDDRATVAWAHDVVSSDELVALVTSVLLRAVDDVLVSGARANQAWLTGHVTELLATDHAEAERSYRQAVQHDPHHGEATWDLARCKSDRGDAGAALGLLRQLRESGGDRDWVEVLERHAAPGPTSAGRNDPCPCGSGRKHKVCCAKRNGWPLDTRFRWMQLKLIHFAVSPAAAPYVEDVFGEHRHLHEIMDDVVLRSTLYHEGGLLEAFADLRGSLLPADELELYRHWAETTIGAYIVVEVDPGRGVVLLDHVTGDRVELADVSLSRSREVDDLVLAWIITTARGREPSGGVLAVPEHAREAALELVDIDPDPEDILTFYHALQAPPRMVNREREPLVLCTVTYTVEDMDVAASALSSELEGDDDLVEFVELIDVGGFPDTVRGTVRIVDGTLVVEANSVVRITRLTEQVERLVPSAVRVDETREPFDASRALANAGVARVGGGEAIEETPELVAALDEWMTEYEESWIDQPIPAFDGATPREAVADPTRRADVERLLRSFDTDQPTKVGPGRPMDPDRLRRLLGLDA